jgi:hypothetical protein
MLNSAVKKSLQWAFILLWFGIASGLVIAMSSNTTKAFDHDNRLAMQLMSLDFERNFVAALRSTKPMRGNRIVHLTSSNSCFCQTLAESHIEKLNTLVEVSDTDVITLNIDQHKDLQKLVPSTPAIAVINAREQLLYYGPYSQGSGCFSSSGEVNSVISRKLLGDTPLTKSNAPETIIKAEAKGCYCHQPLPI